MQGGTSIAIRLKLNTIGTLSMWGVFLPLSAVALFNLLVSPHTGWVDFRHVYSGVEYMADGRNPYQETGYFNPLWVAVALEPLLVLGYWASAEMWFWLNLTALLAASLLVTKGAAWRQRAALIAAAILFAPSLSSLVHGQMTILVLLGAMLPLLTGRYGWLAVLSLPLLTIKPHLGVIPALAAVYLWYHERQYRLLSASVLLTVALLALPLLLRPYWPVEWLTALLQGTGHTATSPVIALVLADFLPTGWAWGVHALLALSLLGWTIRQLSTRRPDARQLLTVACLFAIVMAPYSHAYDFVLLLPIMGLLLSHSKPMVATAFLLPFGQYLGLLSEDVLVVVPLMMLSGCLRSGQSPMASLSSGLTAVKARVRQKRSS